MNIKILFDNQALAGFRSGWGFAALVNGATLFDTGEDAVLLLSNMHAFGVRPEDIETVVLSHEHWDHVGGIAILKECGKVRVCLPEAFSGRFKQDVRELNPQAEIVEVRADARISPDMTATAQLGAAPKEISLAVRDEKGIVLLTGCSHPGLDAIMSHVSRLGNLHAVVGGFHGFGKLKALAGVPVIVPTHCTQKKEEILRMYPGRAHAVAAGSELDL